MKGVSVSVSEEDNLQGWYFAEDDVSQIKRQKHPLLLRQMPVVMSKLQEFKVNTHTHTHTHTQTQTQTQTNKH